MTFALLLAGAIGFVAGLRSMTAPAVVSWAAYLGLVELEGSFLAFMESVIAVGIFSVLAIAELVADKVPFTPARVKPGPLAGRILMGALSGACLGYSGGASYLAGAGWGGLGAVIGSFAGYEIRRRVVRRLNEKDTVVALFEDAFAIGLACLILSRA